MDSEQQGSPGRFELLESIDRQALESLRAIKVEGEVTLLHKVARRYLQTSPTALESLREAVGAGDAPAIAKAAHGLISSTGFLGAVRLVEICREMQRLGESGTLQNAVSLLPLLNAEFEGFCEALTAELS